MLTVVTWKWKKPGFRTTYEARHVNMLARMVAKYYPDPHEVVCVTDDPAGIDSSIRIVPIWDDWREIPSPHSPDQPACYVRLKAFHPDASRWFGERFVSIDLDVVIMDDLRPLWNRDEDWLIWHHRQPSPGANGPQTYCNGTMWMLRTGSHPEVWERFTGEASAREAYAAGHHGSDQGWFSYVLPKTSGWREQDGIRSFNYDFPRTVRTDWRGRDVLPEPLRVVSFHGPLKPWDAEAQAKRWVREHYPIWAVR